MFLIHYYKPIRKPRSIVICSACIKTQSYYDYLEPKGFHLVEAIHTHIQAYNMYMTPE